MLHEGFGAHATETTRCPHCGGYVCVDLAGDQTCLNCGRPVGTSRHLEDVIRKIAQDLIEHRHEQSSKAAAEAR